MARKCVLLALFFAALCPAQDLATTDDGTKILLSTWWRLPGEAFEPLHFAIYRGDNAVWSRAAHTDQGPYLTRPYVSGDGTVIGWERTTPCFGSCMLAVPRSATEFVGLTVPAEFGSYSLSLSRNKRFVLSPGFLGVTDFQLGELATGERWTPPAAPYLRVFGVANTGAVVGLAAERSGGITRAVEPNRVMVWQPGRSATEALAVDAVSNAWISADGARVLVESAGADKAARTLWWVDVGSGQQQRIAQLAPDGKVNFWDPANQQISNDGNRVLYLWPSQNQALWLWQNGEEPRVVAKAEEGFLNAVLSGDGRVIWAFTARGRLLNIAVDAGTTKETLSALPPRLWPTNGGSAAGSAMVLKSVPGKGISQGLHYRSGNLDFPVADESSADLVAVQIPWEAPVRNNLPLVVTGESNPFEMAVPLQLDESVRPVIAGETDTQGRYQVKAALEDFTALVSSEHPAPAGSTIHTWFFNLGPLDRAVPTGMPGPNDPPAVPLAPLGCFLLPEPASPGTPVPIPFLAYAPGLIGVYQADLTIPADFRPGPAILACDSKGATTTGWIPVGRPDLNGK